MVPFISKGFLASYSAAKEWCASSGAAAGSTLRTPKIASTRSLMGQYLLNLGCCVFARQRLGLVIAFITKILFDIGRNPRKIPASGPRPRVSPWVVYRYLVF